jgi:hypothetical protein
MNLYAFYIISSIFLFYNVVIWLHQGVVYIENKTNIRGLGFFYKGFAGAARWWKSIITKSSCV